MTKLKWTPIKQEHLKRAKKVMFVHSYDETYYKVGFLPFTLNKKDIKELISKMDNGLMLEGNMFETGFLPLSIFIFRVSTKEGKIA